MTTIEVTHRTSAAPDIVWGVFTDLDHCADFMDSIFSVERVDAGADFGVGTKWREKRVMFGKSAEELLAVTDVVPGESYTVEATSTGTVYQTTLSVTPIDEGSELRMVFEATPENVMAKVLGATVGLLFEPATRRSMERDLEDIATEAESRSA